MIDKKVVNCDYNGIKPNTLVRNKHNNQIGLCLDVLMVPNYLGEGHYESYDPAAIVLIKGRRAVLSIEYLEVFKD